MRQTLPLLMTRVGARKFKIWSSMQCRAPERQRDARITVKFGMEEHCRVPRFTHIEKERRYGSPKYPRIGQI